jgi:hypothetical protein
MQHRALQSYITQPRPALDTMTPPRRINARISVSSALRSRRLIMRAIVAYADHDAQCSLWPDHLSILTLRAAERVRRKLGRLIDRIYEEAGRSVVPRGGVWQFHLVNKIGSGGTQNSSSGFLRFSEPESHQLAFVFEIGRAFINLPDRIDRVEQ